MLNLENLWHIFLVFCCSGIAIYKYTASCLYAAGAFMQPLPLCSRCLYAAVAFMQPLPLCSRCLYATPDFIQVDCIHA